VISEKTRKQKKHWLPEGIVIPQYHKGNVTRISVRRLFHDAKQKYVILSGSSSNFTVFNDQHPFSLVVETELDGILINQEGNDVINVITIGSTMVKPDEVTHEMLKKSNCILVSLDADKTGTKATEWWLEKYVQARWWPVPVGKDPCEAHQLGLNLRNWISAGIENKIKRRKK